MWSAIAFICISATTCLPNWSNTSVFKTSDECYMWAGELLQSGIDAYEKRGDNILFADAKCVYFNHIILEEGDPT